MVKNLIHVRFVKNLRIVFDDKYIFDEHVNKVVDICYSNIRNLGRIASKLSVQLKIQLVHSMVLSHLDYCNAIFYGSGYLYELVQLMCRVICT